MKQEIKNVGIIGIGEVILEYAYSALTKLETEELIRITKIGDKNCLEHTLRMIDERCRNNPAERESGKDVISRFEQICENMDNGMPEEDGRIGEDRKITHYSTSGMSFDDDTASSFFENMDILYLATPNNVRIELVNQAAQHGVNVIIEKPIGKSLCAVNKTARAISMSGAKGICAEHYAFKQPSIELVSNIGTLLDEMGPISGINAALEEDDFLDAPRYKWLLDPSLSGGGIWLDTGIHMMALIYSIGARANDVITARSYKYPFHDDDPRKQIAQSETAADVIMEICSDKGYVMAGSHARIQVAKCAPKPKKYLQILFEDGEVFLDYMDNSISVIRRSTGCYEKRVLQKADPYEKMMRMFCRYIEGRDNRIDMSENIITAKAATEAILYTYTEMERGDPRMKY